MIRLVIRADDAGSCSEANRAVRECADAGIIRCASIMAVGPALAEAAALLARHPGVETGLHVALNSEWETVTWGPVLAADRVPSLVEPNGDFLPMPGDLKSRGFSVAEAMAEVAAQLERLRDVGFRPVYLDEHCGVSWISEELSSGLDAFAAAEGLLWVARVRSLPDTSILTLGAMGDAPEGDYVVVSHPGIDEPDGAMRRFHLRGAPEDGSVACARDAERRALCEPGLADALRRRGVTLVSYSDLFAG